jgi:hypothetical protein
MWNYFHSYIYIFFFFSSVLQIWVCSLVGPAKGWDLAIQNKTQSLPSTYSPIYYWLFILLIATFDSLSSDLLKLPLKSESLSCKLQSNLHTVLTGMALSGSCCNEWGTHYHETGCSSLTKHPTRNVMLLPP